MLSKRKQIKVDISCGQNGVGETRKKRWQQAAMKEMRDPRLFNAWVRRVLDAQATFILGTTKP